jgi:predicted O-methyltransferase YrrM
MSISSELKVKYPDNKFIFIPSVVVLVVSIILVYSFNLEISFIAVSTLISLFVLTAVFHVYRSVIQEIQYQDFRNQAMLNIHSLVKPSHPLPYLTGWAAFPELISVILSEVLRNKPKHIVEIGSGSSTIITSYILRDLGQGRITSLDHSEFYGNKTKRDLELHDLSEFASIHFIPLVNQDIDGKNFEWYDVSQVQLSDEKIDLLVVDGPPEKTQKHARYPALPIFYEHLSENAIIILDDAARTEEKEIVKSWLEKYPEFTHEYIPTEKGISILKRNHITSREN